MDDCFVTANKELDFDEITLTCYSFYNFVVTRLLLLCKEDYYGTVFG